MVMFKNGKVLFVNNKVAMSPACCCGGTPPICSSYGEWYVNIEGFLDGGPTSIATAEQADVLATGPETGPLYYWSSSDLASTLNSVTNLLIDMVFPDNENGTGVLEVYDLATSANATLNIFDGSSWNAYATTFADIKIGIFIYQSGFNRQLRIVPVCTPTTPSYTANWFKQFNYFPISNNPDQHMMPYIDIGPVFGDCTDPITSTVFGGRISSGGTPLRLYTTSLPSNVASRFKWPLAEGSILGQVSRASL